MTHEYGPGVLGIFDGVDTTAAAIRKLRKAGMKDIAVFSPLPEHDFEEALEAPQSPVRLYTLVGGLTGAASGFALTIWTSIEWPMITGGKPIISLPPFVIIAFELTILLGALSTVFGLLVTARLPRMKPRVIYDPGFSGGQFGIFAAVPPDRADEARRLFNENGASEVRVRPEEEEVGTL